MPNIITEDYEGNASEAFYALHDSVGDLSLAESYVHVGKELERNGADTYIWWDSHDRSSLDRKFRGIMDAGPSLQPGAFAAVTVPPFRKAGRSLLSDSMEVSDRGHSSLEIVVTWPFRPGTSTGTISLSKAPDSCAARARW